MLGDDPGPELGVLGYARVAQPLCDAQVVGIIGREHVGLAWLGVGRRSRDRAAEQKSNKGHPLISMTSDINGMAEKGELQP